MIKINRACCMYTAKYWLVAKTKSKLNSRLKALVKIVTE